MKIPANRNRHIPTILLFVTTMVFLTGNTCALKQIPVGGGNWDGKVNVASSKNPSAKGEESVRGLPPSVLTTVVTTKPKFKGPSSNCARSFDPCYFPRSICCKWQYECPYNMSRDDCKADKQEEFCCKYM